MFRLQTCTEIGDGHVEELQKMKNSFDSLLFGHSIGTNSLSEILISA
jgi:hypothetical protein